MLPFAGFRVYREKGANFVSHGCVRHEAERLFKLLRHLGLRVKREINAIPPDVLEKAALAVALQRVEGANWSVERTPARPLLVCNRGTALFGNVEIRKL